MKQMVPTTKRPQSLRIRDSKPQPQPQFHLNNRILQLSKPKDPPPILEFSIGDKVVRHLHEPFLWESLVTENTQLKNIVTQLRKQNECLREEVEDLNAEVKRMGKEEKRQNKSEWEDVLKQKLKKREQLETISHLRLRESELKARIEVLQEERRSTHDQCQGVKAKHQKILETRVKMQELKQLNRVLTLKTSENITSIFEAKFPSTNKLLFQVLNVFKKVEKIVKSPHNLRLTQFLKLIFQNVIQFGRDLWKVVGDWVKYIFFNQPAYHPSNSQLIEAMLDKWRHSSQTAQQLYISNRKLLSLERLYAKLLATCENHEEHIRLLEINNENVLFRNQKIEELLEVRCSDFAYTLFQKFRRYQEEMRSQVELRDPESSDLGVLVEPEYLKLKEMAQTLKEAVELNRSLRQRLKEEAMVAKEEEIQSGIEEMREEMEHKRERRSVVILKKNVYGYWVDPNFNTCLKSNKKPHQKYLHKATQTTQQTQFSKRLFFNLIVYKAQLRSVVLKLDPYIKLQYSSGDHKTATKSGKEPVWNQNFTFEQRQTSMEFLLMDKQKLGRDTLFGSAAGDFSKVFLDNSTDQIKMELRLQDAKGEFVGRLWIGIWMLEFQDVIHIREIEGNLQVQKDVLSEMDPYCVFKIDSKVLDHTSVARKAGVRPVWREEFMLFIDEKSETFETQVKDEDLVADDDIGCGSIEISSIPGEEEEMVLELVDQEESVGNVKFKIFKKRYINEGVRKKEKVIIKLDIPEERFFVLEGSKLTVDNKVLPPLVEYRVEYGGVVRRSVLKKGKEVFWGDTHLFKISISREIQLVVTQKHTIGDDTSLMEFTHNATQNINGNYSDTEVIDCSRNSATFSIRFCMVPVVETFFVKAIVVDPVKQVKQSLVVSFKAGGIDEEFEVMESKGDLRHQFESAIQLSTHSEVKSLNIELVSQGVTLATGTVPTSSILNDYLTEVSIPLQDKTQILYGKITLLIGRHKYTNTLNSKTKEERLILGKRDYFQLDVHRASLNRDTELFGSMTCYCRLQYLKKCRTKTVKGGKQPQWDQCFVFFVQPQIPLSFEVMDEEKLGKDDLVGSGALDVVGAFEKGEETVIGNLAYQQQHCGQVFFSLSRIGLQMVVFVRMVRAEIYEDTDWVGKIDPYFVIQHNGDVLFRSEILDEKGQNPLWEIALEVQISDPLQPLELLLYDKDLIGEDCLGMASFSVSQFTQIIQQITSPLLKDSQNQGIVFITAACNKFTNLKQPQSKPQVPAMFSTLNIMKLTLIDLKSKENTQLQIRYNSPFQKQTVVPDKSRELSFNSHEFLNVSEPTLQLHFFKPNVLKGAELKHSHSINLTLALNEAFREEILPIANTKGKHVGTLRYSLERVSHCWVIYVKEYKLKTNSEANSMLSIRTDVDQYQTGQPGENNAFWVFSVGEEVTLGILEKSVFGEQSLGEVSVNIDIISEEGLKWRDFIIPQAGTISLYCAKHHYQSPFLSTLPLLSRRVWRIVHISRAQMTRDVQVFGKMDLYCTLQGSDQTMSTGVLDNIGMEPQWNETLVMSETGSSKYLVSVFDSEVMKDRLVGSVEVDFGMGEGGERRVELGYEEKLAGTLYLSCQTVRKYISLFSIQHQPKETVSHVAIRNNSVLLFSKEIQKGSQLSPINVSVPLMSDTLVVQVNSTSYPLDIQELTKQESATLVLGALTLGFRLFLHE